jgi:hypothetical protein
MKKEEVIKKTLYEFKKFAREWGFWEEYKTLSYPINARTDSFIGVIGKCEPVELIQNATYFCSWPIGTYNIWHRRSQKWANICLNNGLFFDEDKARTYVRTYIGYINKT